MINGRMRRRISFDDGNWRLSGEMRGGGRTWISPSPHLAPKEPRPESTPLHKPRRRESEAEAEDDLGTGSGLGERS
jgi:hypothetical protein